MLPIVLGLLLSLMAVGARTSTLEEAKIKETVFPNGLRLLVKESRATDLASLQLWVRAGGFLEDERTTGTAHVIEHLLFKGDEPGGPGSIDGEIENLGGSMDASTDRDWTRFNCTVAGRYVGKVVGVIGEALRKAQFRAEDWEAEKPVVLEEIARVRTNPEAALTTLLYEPSFRTHPYRLDVRGNPRMINTLDLKDVRAYYQKHYVPANMTLVVVGNVDTAGVERAVRTAFLADQPAPKAAPPALPANETACAQPVRRVLDSPFQNGYVALAYPAPSVKDEPDVYAMDVLLTLLENGDSGRLPRILKDQGAVEATFETRRQPGLFTVVALTTGATVEQTETLLRREIEFVGTRGAPEAELAVAKRSLRGSYAMDCESYAGQAGSLGYYAAIDRWQFASQYLSKVESVTAAQVQDVARKYLSADHCTAVLLKPRPAAPPGGARPPSVGT